MTGEIADCWTKPTRTPFEKFADLTKRLFAVPKTELDEKLEAFKVRQQKKQAAL
jgi:hypothetical protein